MDLGLSAENRLVPGRKWHVRRACVDFLEKFTSLPVHSHYNTSKVHLQPPTWTAFNLGYFVGIGKRYRSWRANRHSAAALGSSCDAVLAWALSLRGAILCARLLNRPQP
jgi:hypothetical protein